VSEAQDLLAPGARARVLAPSPFRGMQVTVRKHYPPTGNYLVECGTSTFWIPDACLEVLG